MSGWIREDAESQAMLKKELEILAASEAEADGKVCWVNEDCIAGWHMGEIECRFPSWQNEPGWTADQRSGTA